MLAVIASDDVETFITLNSGPLETWKYHWMDVMPEAIKSKGDKIATYILSQLDDSNYEIVHTFMFPAMIGYGKSNLVKLTVEKYPQIKKSRTVGPFWQEGMESIYRPNKGVDFYSCLGDKIGKEFLTKLLDDSLDEDFLYYVLNISVEEDNPKVFGLALNLLDNDILLEAYLVRAVDLESCKFIHHFIPRRECDILINRAILRNKLRSLSCLTAYGSFDKNSIINFAKSLENEEAVEIIELNTMKLF